MDIKTIGVEDWLNVWEKSATYDIAQSTIASMTMGEILQLDGQAGATFYDRLNQEKMNYGWIEGSPEFRGVHWVRSAPMFFECLPEGIDKAAGYKQLIKAIGAADRFTVAAGDFMNDLAMIQSADLGAAVANAQPSVREAADIVLCDNNSGAMAQLINYINKL